MTLNLWVHKAEDKFIEAEIQTCSMIHYAFRSYWHKLWKYFSRRTIECCII